jgi:UDPglucose 6-dehydrogenase
MKPCLYKDLVAGGFLISANIGIIGTGYVGLVTGVCFAELGHNVICSDVVEEKIKKLNKGESPIYEPGLEEILAKTLKNGKISFTLDNKEVADKSDFIFICVPTPDEPDGSANLTFVYKACEEIAKNLTEPKYIIIKSTLPVTSVDSIRRKINENTDIGFELLSNPEFLAQGTAVKDSLNPDRVVIGADNKEAAQKLRELYANVSDENVVLTNIASAIMTKYASNAFLATKISYINAIANLCEKVGADVEKVAEGMRFDERIGNKFLFPGIGYGGSCFPKDTKALYKMANEVGYDFILMEDVIKINESQRVVAVKKLKKIFGDLKGKNVAVLGLAFKPKTDDLREAPSRYIIRELIKNECSVAGYDPVVKNLVTSDPNNNNWEDIKDIKIYDNAYEAAKGADALVIATEYDEFKKDLDFYKLANLVRTKVIVDGRNILPVEELKKHGFKYCSIGRPCLPAMPTGRQAGRDDV